MKKLVAMLLAGTMVFGMTACGGNSESTDDSSKTTADDSASTEDSSVAGEDSDAAKASGETAKVRMLVFDGGVESYTEALQPFIAEHPEIEIELVPAGNDVDALRNNPIQAHQAGEGYDIMFVNHVDTLSFIQAGMIQPITSYAEADDVDYSEILYPDLYELGIYKDEIYAVQVDTGIRLFACNKELFDKYDVELPETMDEFLAAAQTLTVPEDNVYGFGNQIGGATYSPGYEMGMFLTANGGKLWEIDSDGNAVAQFDQPVLKEYFEYVVELSKCMAPNGLSMNMDDIEKQFLSGNIAMMMWGSWNLDRWLDEIDIPFEYEIIPVPAGSAGSVTTGGGYQLCMGSQSKYPEATWEVMKYLTSDVEALTNLAAIAGSLPTTPAGFELAPFNDAKYDVIEEQMASGATLSAIPVANTYEAYVEIFNVYEAMCYGNITVDEALEQAQANVQPLLDESYE